MRTGPSEPSDRPTCTVARRAGGGRLPEFLHAVCAREIPLGRIATYRKWHELGRQVRRGEEEPDVDPPSMIVFDE